MENPLRGTLVHKSLPLHKIYCNSWNPHLDEGQFHVDASRCKAYLRHYEDYCEQCPFTGLGVLTHNDVLFAVNQLKPETRKDRETSLARRLYNLLQAGHGDIVNDSIKFEGESLILLDLAPWRASDTIKRFVNGSLLQPSMQKDSLRLPRSFNARAMAQVAGFRIRWTSDLSKHLAMSENDEEISVFHHATYLDLVAESNFDLFSSDFIEETRRTLSLLLSQSDKRTGHWFRGQAVRNHLDIKAGRCPFLKSEDRNTTKVTYWRDHLLIAKEVFDEHEPRGRIQSWRDNRKTTQWWTFWIAIVVFILAVIQVVQGTLQVYKAFHPSPGP